MSLPSDHAAPVARHDDTHHPRPEPSVIIPTMIGLRYHTAIAAGHDADEAMYLTMQNHYAPALRRALAAEARRHVENEHLQEMLDGRMRYIELLHVRWRKVRAGRSPRHRLTRWWRAGCRSVRRSELIRDLFVAGISALLLAAAVLVYYRIAG